MNKKLFIFMNVIVVSVALHGMDKIPLHNLKRSETAGGSKSRRQDGVENKQDIRLDLSSLPEPIFASANGKQSVKNLKQVTNLKSAQETHRASTGRGSSDAQKERINMLDANNDNRGVNNNLIVDHNDDNQDDIGNIQTKRRSMLETLSSSKVYSSQDMWDFFQTIHPKLFEYATENHLSIEDVSKYANILANIDPQVNSAIKQYEQKKSLTVDEIMECNHLLENFDITSEALAELVKKQHGFSDEYMQGLAKKFEGLQKKDPSKREELALDFMMRTLDEGGIKKPSPIHAAHVAIQKDEINAQKSQIYYQYVALGVTFATTIAGYAWAIYGQVSGTATNGPTMSPTGAPTNASTGFPTGSPI